MNFRAVARIAVLALALPACGCGNFGEFRATEFNEEQFVAWEYSFSDAATTTVEGSEITCRLWGSRGTNWWLLAQGYAQYSLVIGFSGPAQEGVRIPLSFGSWSGWGHMSEWNSPLKQGYVLLDTASPDRLKGRLRATFKQWSGSKESEDVEFDGEFDIPRE